MRRLAVVLVAVAVASPAIAAPWSLIEREGQNRAAVSNEPGTISLNIFCGGDGAMVGVERAAGVPWQKGGKAELVVGDQTFAIAPFAEGDTWGVFNIDPVSAKPALVEALRQGATLTLRGDAATGLPAGDLSFTLKGSSKALDQVPGGCT